MANSRLHRHAATRFVVAGVWLAGLGLCPAGARAQFEFDGKISRPALEAYLSRSITMMDLLTGRGNLDDNIRMLTNIGAKFAGRTIYLWGGERHLPAKLASAKTIAPKIHAADPQIILQACVFEIVTRDVNQLPVPAWVFDEFGLDPQQRTFRYEAMCAPNGRHVDMWSKGASAPDITQLETKLFFYYLAVSYINVGCEAIHFGQVRLIGANDPTHQHWWDLLSRVRRYANVHARRHLVLCDAHTPDGGRLYQGDKLLFDFHSFPLRIDEVPDRPHQGVLRMGYLDSIFGRSKGGVTPSGWSCQHLPYLVELDNFEATGRAGQNVGAHWIWGYDEISWFAHQTETYRSQWLRYASKWIRQNDPNGFLQMPGSRCIAPAVEIKPGRKTGWYFANRTSQAAPDGFGQEDTIKAIWAENETTRSAERESRKKP